MTLADLKKLVENAERVAKDQGKTDSEYEVYAITGSAVRDIRSWSPLDWNRSGVALILAND
jgi:hypothetical protein